MLKTNIAYVSEIELIIFGIFICFGIILMLYLIFKSPFHYPYFKHYFDVTGRRNPKIEDLIDTFLIEKRFLMVIRHKEKIESWKLECQNKINKSILKKYRLKQYSDCLDDGGAYEFYLTRKQTRYHQSNYVRTSYKIDQVVSAYHCSYE